MILWNRRNRRSLASDTPASIADLFLWYDAADTATITESGGNVSQWDDKSGNDNHLVQATAAAQPLTGDDTLNGRNVLSFVTNNFMDTSSNVTLDSSFTCFIVVNNVDVSGVGNEDLFRIGISGAVTYVNAVSSNQWAMFNGAVLQSTYDATNDSGIITSIYNSTSSTLRHTGVVVASGDSGADSTTGILTICNKKNYNGDLAEVLFYDRVLTSDEVDRVESYLMSKWGLS